jgi:hypothetical protein
MFFFSSLSLSLCLYYVHAVYLLMYNLLEEVLLILPDHDKKDKIEFLQHNLYKIKQVTLVYGLA